MKTVYSIDAGVLKRRLKKPYELSFHTVEKINSLWISVKYSDGSGGFGEAVPLPGYGSETVESILDFFRKTVPGLVGLSQEEVMSELTRHRGGHNSFAVSAIATAIEFYQWIRKADTIARIPLVFPLRASKKKESLSMQVEEGIRLGYRHFKMKIGKDVDTDIFSAEYILNVYEGMDLLFRFDANQAYDFDRSAKFCKSIGAVNKKNVLWLEQPLKIDAWDDTRALCEISTVPIMLDECIYNEHDIERAKEVGCAAVKLKLCKHMGISHCVQLAKAARKLGLMVTLGNGVSSDIGNLCEGLAINEAPNLFVEGSECNGFIKLEDAIAFKQINVSSGNLIWEKGGGVVIDEILEKIKKESDIQFHEE